MAFGVLFNFAGNSNVSKIIKAADMIKEQWFIDAVNYDKPVDLFLVIGHNPVRAPASDTTSTMGLLHSTIRAMRPEAPIQFFGGHTHIRDFKVFDDMSTGLESGRYCETLGWVSMSGINSSTFTGNQKPRGVANPSRKASNTSSSSLVYSRRYLDWNRLTFEYHATKSQASTFDYHSGLRVTDDISAARKKLNLTSLYGCAPATYCASCKPVNDPGNINTLIETALAATVINASRADVARYIIVNSGSIRFDLVKGPFTYDDSFIVSPFADAFQYIPNVPYALAKNVLNLLNGAPLNDKRDSFGSMPLLVEQDSCIDPSISMAGPISGELKTRGVSRRQTTVTAGYTTTDDFGTDGDDTPHSSIPYYTQPNYIQGNASFPTTGTPALVDVVFFDYFAATVVKVLNQQGGAYTIADVGYYVPSTYTAQNYLPDYAKLFWQANMPNCPVS